MNRKKIFVAVLVLILIGTILTFVGVVKAQSPAFSLTRSVIGSGGMGGSAEGYSIHSTLGQPVAGSGISGDYTFTSGFWGQALMEWFEYFLPLILR